MVIRHIEFTSGEAATLIPIVNAVITLHESVFERRIECLNVKKLAYLKEVVGLLHDGIDLDLEVVIEVNEYYYFELQLIKDILIDMSAIMDPVAKEPYIIVACKIDKILQYYCHVKAVKC